ncbi:MAG: 1-deoxy-D-xylulose-5-phosphate synthase N-terminal domain-containing protein [Microthrixaceae bacterium]
MGHRPPGLRAQARHRPPSTSSIRSASPGGLSGYPSRTESAHDWIENSHASTVLSYAHGLATAQQPRRRAQAPDRRGDR